MNGARAVLVADAWGAHTWVGEALARFLEMAAGRGAATVRAAGGDVAAGGGAHVIAFVGHNPGGRRKRLRHVPEVRARAARKLFGARPRS